MRFRSSFLLFYLILMIAFISLAPAQNQDDKQNKQTGATLPQFAQIVAFDLTLERLAAQVSAGDVSGIPKDRYLTIDGVVSSRQLVNEAEQDYLGILELSSGDWVNGENLEIYRCYVQLRGPEFFGTVPKPRSREKSPNEIPLHAHVLLVGRYLGYGQDQDGNRFPVLQAVEYRILEK